MDSDTLTSPRPSLTPTASELELFDVPCSGAELLRQIDDQRFTGCVTLDGSRIEVYALDGIVYHVDGTAAPSIESLLLVEQLVTPADLDAGVLKLKTGTYVGRLTDRVPHLDADAIRVVVEMAIEDRLTVVAQQQVVGVETVMMRKHRSGIHRLLGLGRYFTVPFPTATESVVAEPAEPVRPAMPEPEPTQLATEAAVADPVVAEPALPDPEAVVDEPVVASEGADQPDDSVIVDAPISVESIAAAPAVESSPETDTKTGEAAPFEFNLDDLFRSLDLDRDQTASAEPAPSSAAEPSLELRLSCLDHLL